MQDSDVWLVLRHQWQWLDNGHKPGVEVALTRALQEGGGRGLGGQERDAQVERHPQLGGSEP